ncbi:MAG: adenosylmethionine--8-amino-7-oxononanoate transaminase [Candidatus Lightella neohaematopini]|nr:adenosylmethionine--8-amino-7-oxononanoate transaminase [Candidatus Lightella neohaematopini]
MNINNLKFDRKYIWHPYASMSNPLPAYQVNYAYSYKLVLSNGKKLIDGMSSWWSAIHGYNHPVINRALRKQIRYMSHVMFGGITHIPAIKLCKNLIKITPGNLNCIFLADSGSVSVEVAIKMALQYWYSLRISKNKFISLYHGYHGDTLGAMSVSDPYNSMHRIYRNYFSNQLFVNVSKCRFHDVWTNDTNHLDNLIKLNHHHVAAIILEPIVQGAGGMYFYHPQYLVHIRKLCDKYKILLIADEIATGFGRTGKLFACNYAKVVPDILCIGKALTGGTMTLAATITNRKIANIISNNDIKCFMHGPTFMGNPLACVAANASLKLLNQYNWKKCVLMINEQLKKDLLPLIDHERVQDVRILGAIGVVETKHKINIANIQCWFIKYGVWIRPFNKLIYIMPPYIIKQTALKILTSAIKESLNINSNFIIT